MSRAVARPAEKRGTISAMAASKSPLVSIIVPTYNRWPLIRETVESVRAQSCKDLELIVVDDGSTDGTACRLERLDEPVRVIVQENAERGAARNRGLAEAAGRYVCFIDADDVLEPHCVAQLAGAVTASSNTEAFYGPAWLWDQRTGQTRVLGGEAWTPEHLRHAVLRQTVVPLPGVFVRRELAVALGGFPESRAASGNEDYVFVARVIMEADPLTRLRKPAMRIRDHDQRSMREHAARVDSGLAAMHILLRDGVGSDRPLTNAERRDVIGGTARFCAAHCYANAERRTARDFLAVYGRAFGPRTFMNSGLALWLQSWVPEQVLRRLRWVRSKVVMPQTSAQT